MNITRRKTILKSAILNSVFVGFSVSIILWFTILDRSESRRVFLTPGWTISSIISGNTDTLIESALNICLFIPFGFFLSRFKNISFKLCLIVGLISSIAVEVIQYIAMVGYSELDDVVYNTTGMIIGYAVVRVTKFYVDINISFVKTIAITLVSAIVLYEICIAGNSLIKACTYSKYANLASLHDIDENTPNLLVLNGNKKFYDDIDVDIAYNRDGTISINGSSNTRTWLLISEFSLEPGEYFFAGLDGVNENTVALELEAYSCDKDNYVRFSPDIGPIDSYFFTLTETTYYRAYIGVYECDDINATATPVLYQIEGGNYV